MNKILYMITVLIIAVFVLTACRKNDATVYFSSENSQMNESVESTEHSSQNKYASPDKTEKTIVVYVCGQVANAGVYELAAESRVADAIECAGGMTDDASRDFWNLAEILSDGQMIYVPSVDEAADGTNKSLTSADNGKSDLNSKVNINTASKDELMTLTGIGANKADNIVQYRQENGNFSKIDDLKNVSGIGESIYNKIKDSITV